MVPSRLRPVVQSAFVGLVCLVSGLGQVALPARAAEPAETAQLPPGGTSLLPDDTLAAFGPFGKGEHGKFEKVEVSGQTFTHAWRATTVSTPPNQWELQLGAHLQKPIKKGSTLFLRFHMRAVKGQAETGEARTQVGVATGGPEWAKSMAESIGIPSTWKRFDIPFTARYDTPVNGSIVCFDMGFAPQSFEVGGIELIDYGATRSVADLPRTRAEYAGQEDNAPWRAAALARIEKIRKGDMEVRVVDTAGKPVADAAVAVRMLRHTFPFGSAVSADTLVEQGPTGDKYRQIILKNYNVAVIENHLKWPFWEAAWTHPAAEQAVDWLFGHDIKMPISGPLVWGGWGNLPDDLKERQGDTAFLLKRIADHIAKITATYGSKITEWEVINEPYGQNDLWKIIGYEKMADFFHLARKAAPNAHLTINDYPPLDGAATSNAHLNAYYGYIDDLIKAKAPINGIGFQCHFGSNVVPPERVLSGLDRFARLGLPISITEFDIESTDEDLQRRYMRDFMTATFSHPSVDAVVMWGFWEGKHWIPPAALYRQDWSIKPHGQMWLDLVKRDWWTNADGKTAPSGAYQTRGFFGFYEITVSTPDGQTKTVYHTLGKSAAPLTIKMDGAVNVAPKWLSVVRKTEADFNAAIDAGIPMLAGNDFNMLSDPANGSAEVIDLAGQSSPPSQTATRFKVLRATPNAWEVQALIVTNQPVTKGDRVTVAFWCRSAPGSTGGKLTANFQTNGPDYTVFASKTLSPSPEWQKTELKFTAPSDRPAGATMLVLQMGHQPQAMEIAGPSATNFGPKP